MRSRGPRTGSTLALVGALMASLLVHAPVSAAGTDDARLGAVISEGVPRGLVTVIVPIPVELTAEREVHYEVSLTAGIQVMGRMSGLARTGGAPVRPLVLTLRIPAGADAGTIEAAEVAFRGGSGREFIVPLQLRVSVVRAITVAGTREMRGLRAGDRLALPYRIVNAGNSSETVRITLRGPDGWSVRLDRPATALIGARAQLEFTVTVGIPSSANLGDHTLAVSIQGSADTEVVSTAFATLGITGRAGATAGLVLRPTVAVAASSLGEATFSSVEIAGPITPSASIRAQIAPVARRGGLTMQGLSTVGAISAPFSAAVFGESWDVSAGNTSLQLTDLSGVNVTGQGLTANMETRSYEARAIIARPGSGTRELGGQLLGGGLWRATALGRFGGSIAHLTERGALTSGRELTAVAADYRSRPVGTLTLGAALAHRQSGDAAGLGYALRASHERPRDRASLSVTHAPGGSAAFARAVDEWQFEASRSLTDRWFLDGSAHHSSDRGVVFTGMEVLSWNVGQRFAVTPTTAASLRMQSSSFDARTDPTTGIGDFGARDRELVGSFDWRRDLLALSVEGTLGAVARTSELLGGRLYETTAAKRGLGLLATRGFDRWGALDANASLEQTAAGVGVPPHVWSVGLRWTNFPVALGTRQVRINTEAALHRLGDLSPSLVTRTTMVTALPGGLDLALSAERNPFFRDARGRAGWIAALRLSAATRVYTPAASGPEGTVYEDRDLDGVRDPLEPGIPGVILRRGDARVTTDRFGRYRLPVTARGRTRIDQGSLPLGLVAHPMLTADTLERLELPVLPTGTALVELRLEPDDAGRIPDVDLRPAIVMLRDASGFAWVGRRTSDSTALFADIPIGPYTLTFNFARLALPLRAADGIAVRVTPRTTERVRVPLRGRSVRIFTPPSRATAATRGAAQP